MGKMKEFFDAAYGPESDISEAEVERMQLQAAMSEVSYITEDLKQALYRNQYYNDPLTFERIERITNRLESVLKTYN